VFTKQSIITGESTQGEHEAQNEAAQAENKETTPEAPGQKKKSGELTLSFYNIEKVNCLEII
jgi:hypothetical protein